MEKENLILYRKRLIPDECVLLKDDTILMCDDEMIITKWNTLRPKRDLHHGYSCYFLKEGFKVSKYLNEDGALFCWYCDIVDYDYEEKSNTLIATDLLADVIIYPDGYVKVVDLDELASAIEMNLCDTKKVTDALKHLDHLLQFIYEDKFDYLTEPIRKWSAASEI